VFRALEAHNSVKNLVRFCSRSWPWKNKYPCHFLRANAAFSGPRSPEGAPLRPSRKLNNFELLSSKFGYLHRGDVAELHKLQLNLSNSCSMAAMLPTVLLMSRTRELIPSPDYCQRKAVGVRRVRAWGRCVCGAYWIIGSMQTELRPEFRRMSRSIVTRASSARRRLISICSAVTPLLPMTPFSFPARCNFIQLPRVCSTTPRLRAARRQRLARLNKPNRLLLEFKRVPATLPIPHLRFPFTIKAAR
jgi:hypothetical protein